MAQTSDRVKAASLLAIALALPAECIRRVAYYDPPGILTVCAGHTGADVVKDKIYSLTECKSMLNVDMLKAVEAVDRCAPGLPENVLAAFSDAAYNMGPRIACDPKNSRAARLLKMGAILAACDELPKWDKARVAGVLISLPGLTKRRTAERELCMGEAAS